MLLSLQGATPQAILALADGTVYIGNSIGATGTTVGEVVFNTAMTGYQEILTDPSYCRQIVTLTYPHIGNYGVNAEDVEADKVHAAGLIIKDLPLVASNFRQEMSLADYLQREGTVAIANIDTRKLTRQLRTQGAQNGCIMALTTGQTASQSAMDQAVALAKAAPSMSGLDLAKVVSVNQSYPWSQTEWALSNLALGGKPGYGTQTVPRFHVVAYDFGVKKNILRMLSSRGCQVTVVPAQTSAAEVLQHKPDGIFLSNGPGDPAALPYVYPTIQALIQQKKPMFGICLGHQILAHALGGNTYKLKFGHRGGNQPVLNQQKGAVEITAQNHGFAVDPKTLNTENVEFTHLHLNDETCSGMCHKKLPIFSVQYHPEASPGPHDSRYLFDQFTRMMDAAKGN